MNGVSIVVREYTCKVLELMNEGVIDPKWLAEALASWCSEDNMKEFYERCLDFDDFPIDEEEEEEEEQENQIGQAEYFPRKQEALDYAMAYNSSSC